MKIMDMDQINEIIESANDSIIAGTEPVTDEIAERLRELIYNLYVGNVRYGDDFIAVHSDSLHSWQYYAGYEYIYADCVSVIGDWTVFDADEDSGRVEKVLAVIRETVAVQQ